MKALTIILAVAMLAISTGNNQTVNSQNLVPAQIKNGHLIPVINLPMVNIVANPDSAIEGYTLPVVTIIAPKENSNLLPATKWNNGYIATSQLNQVDIIAKKKKTLLASFFSFNWLYKTK